MSTAAGLDSYSTAIIVAGITTPVVTGVFGVVLLRLQQKVHRAVRSPNGIETGDNVYEQGEKLAKVIDRQTTLAWTVNTIGERQWDIMGKVDRMDNRIGNIEQARKEFEQRASEHRDAIAAALADTTKLAAEEVAHKTEEAAAVLSEKLEAAERERHQIHAFLDEHGIDESATPPFPAPPVQPGSGTTPDTSGS